MWTNGIRALRERRLELCFEAALRPRTDDALRLRAILEEDQRRDRKHVELRRRLLVVVDVQRDDADIVALVRHLLENRVDHSARTAPRRPEVDEHGFTGVQNIVLKVGVGYVRQLAGHVVSWSWATVESGSYYTK